MGGIRYHFFVTDLPYPTFAATYLSGEVSDASPEDIYDRYATIGGNPSCIKASVIYSFTSESLGPAPAEQGYVSVWVLEEVRGAQV